MNQKEASILVDEYKRFLTQEVSLYQTGEYIAVVTPFLDRKNDYIKVYLSFTDTTKTFIKISDDGDTISELELCGCDITTPKRKEILSQILAGHGVKLNEQTKAIEVETSPANFAIKKHLFLQAILAVNDMYNLAQPSVLSLFKEDAANWLSANSVAYVLDVQVVGKAYPHTMDFMIPKTSKRKEIGIRAINNPSRDYLQSAIFTYLDASDRFQKTTDFALLINDNDHSKASKALDVLSGYPEIHPFLWSEKEKFLSIANA